MQLNAGPEVTERRRAGALRRGLHAPRAVQAGCLCFLLCILVAVVCLVIVTKIVIFYVKVKFHRFRWNV